jgi:carbonic anhydrase
MSSTVFYGTITLLVAAAGAAGYSAGGRAPTNDRNLGKLGGAALGGVAMVAVGKNLQKERGQAAGVQLHNELVRRGGPNNVTKQDIDALAQRFGLNKHQAYELYLEALSQGDGSLSGEDKAAFDEAMSNAEAWQKGNETYKKTFGNKGVLKSPPKKKVAVVACMDARFHLEKALALKEGDAHIIRNAGGRVSEDVIRSLAISQQLLGTEEVAVIHHTDCGMATFEDPTLVAKINANLGPEAGAAAKNIKFLNFHGIDLEESVRVDIKALKDSPLLTPASKNKLTGYIYDVKSGGLHTVPA